MTRLLLALLGIAAAAALAGTSDASLPAVVIVVAILLVALLTGIATPESARALLSRAQASINVSIVPSECDPDAPGHPRPRAPGCAASPA